MAPEIKYTKVSTFSNIYVIFLVPNFNKAYIIAYFFKVQELFLYRNVALFFLIRNIKKV